MTSEEGSQPVAEEVDSFDLVLPALKRSYASWKEFEAHKNNDKSRFFELATQAIEDQGKAMNVVDITALSEASAIERAKRHYPDRLVDSYRAHPWKPGSYEVILVEDAAYQPFSIEHDGTKYSRTVSKGAVMLDEEWLAEEDPTLYTDVTFQLPWGAVIPLPIEQLAPETLTRLKKYIYNDKPRVSLAAPRAVKTEE